MDKLLVDLDQVLDDLEESEKNNQNYAFNQQNCLSLKEELQIDQNQSNRLDLLNDNLKYDNSKIVDLKFNKLDNILTDNIKSNDDKSNDDKSNDDKSSDDNKSNDLKQLDLKQLDLLKDDNLKNLDTSNKNDLKELENSLLNDLNDIKEDNLKQLDNDFIKNLDNSKNLDTLNNDNQLSNLINNQNNDEDLNNKFNDKSIDKLIDQSNDKQLFNYSNYNKKSNQQSTELNFDLSYQSFESNLDKNLINEQFSDNTVNLFSDENNQNIESCEQLKNDLNELIIEDDKKTDSISNNLINKNDNYLNDEDINYNNNQLLDKESTINLVNDNCISLKDELLIEEKGSINREATAVNKMSNYNPFEEDNNLDNLDNNLNSNLESSNNLNVYSQKSSSSSSVKSFNEKDHLNLSCSVNESLLVDANDSNSYSNIQQPPAQLVSNFQTSNTRTDYQPTTSFLNRRYHKKPNEIDNFSYYESINVVYDDKNNEDNQNNTTTNAEIINENNNTTINTTINDSTLIDTTNENIDTSTNLDDIFSNSVGYLKPYWQPDKEAPVCMFCNAKFNIFIRRHHCRACGKVGCSECCHYFIKLPYLGFKESRVCKVCVNLLDCLRDGEVDSRRSSRASSIFNQSHNQNSTSISDLSIATNSTNMGAIMPTTSNSQIRPIDNQPSSPILVPVSVLKKADRPRAEAQSNKQVKFADGLVPGVDLFENQSSTNSNNSKSNNSGGNTNSNTITNSFPSLSTFSTLLFSNSSPSSSNSSPKSTEQQINSAIKKSSNKNKKDSYNLDLILHDLNGPLPPLINSTSLLPESTFADIVNYLDSDESNYLKFQITKNLCINVNRVFLDCCTKMKCWSFYSEGLQSFGQDEILILLESLDAEVYFPRDVLRLYLHVYDNAIKGKPLQENNLMLFEEGLFESRDNSGFLFFRPSFQCLKKIKKPQSPFICGILIQKWEIPFSKLLPLRLLLRLGTQSKSYPFPIISQWTRKQVFQEIGHTIMQLLADFRNFQYTLPFIPGLYVELHLLPNNKRKIVVKIANNRHDLILKALNSSSNSVLSFGSNLNLTANYQLTCLQVDEQYLTQIFSKDGTVKDFNLNNLESNNEYISEVIGVSFIVFSGALKNESGLNAKNGIVEDGILVQLLPASLEKLKNALKQKTDFTLNCGQKNSKNEQDETVSVEWTEDDLQFNLGVTSQIDNRSLEGIESIRIYNNNGGCSSERHLIRWTEVFFLQYDPKRSINNVEYTRMASLIAQSFLVLLTPHLEKLTKENIRKISLRVNLNPDNVDNYAVATNVGPMPTYLTTELDSSLIPLIIQLQTNELDQKLIIELLFFILNK